MDTIQEAFLLLGLVDVLPTLKPHQLYSLIYHALNLKVGFTCTGFQEDDPQPAEPLVNLPREWLQLSDEVVSFRYKHNEAAPGVEFYFKYLQAGDKLEVNAMTSAKNYEIWNLEVDMEELKLDKFDNLDSWVPTKLQKEYDRDIVSKLLPKKKEEQKD
jgi:PI31 proteasome regulator N-terminal